MLHLILADSEIEQVPAEIADHKIISWQARKRARRPTELILNSSLHHKAMEKLPDAERRGRPDIVHFFLSLALDSPLNLEGQLRVYIHTRNDQVILVDPSVNLPRSYNRFEGLMEQLFMTGAAPPEKPLLVLKKLPLAELVQRIQPYRTIAFSEKGANKKLSDIFGRFSISEEICAIVGGFPHGDYISNLDGVASEVVSIYPKLLTAPAVASSILCAYEQRFEII